MLTLDIPKEVDILAIWRPGSQWTGYYCVMLEDYVEIAEHYDGRDIPDFSQVIYGERLHEKEGAASISVKRGDVTQKARETGTWTVTVPKGTEWACWSPRDNGLYARESAVFPPGSSGTLQGDRAATEDWLLISDGVLTLSGVTYFAGDAIDMKQFMSPAAYSVPISSDVLAVRAKL